MLQWIQYKKEHQWYYSSSTFAEASTIQHPSNGGVELGVNQTLMREVSRSHFDHFIPIPVPKIYVPLSRYKGDGVRDPSVPGFVIPSLSSSTLTPHYLVNSNSCSRFCFCSSWAHSAASVGRSLEEQ